MSTVCKYCLNKTLDKLLPSFSTSSSLWPLLSVDAEECLIRDSDDSNVLQSQSCLRVFIHFYSLWLNLTWITDLTKAAKQICLLVKNEGGGCFSYPRAWHQQHQHLRVRLLRFCSVSLYCCGEHISSPSVRGHLRACPQLLLKESQEFFQATLRLCLCSYISFIRWFDFYPAVKKSNFMQI